MTKYTTSLFFFLALFPLSLQASDPYNDDNTVLYRNNMEEPMTPNDDPNAKELTPDATPSGENKDGTYSIYIEDRNKEKIKVSLPKNVKVGAALKIFTKRIQSAYYMGKDDPKLAAGNFSFQDPDVQEDAIPTTEGDSLFTNDHPIKGGMTLYYKEAFDPYTAVVDDEPNDDDHGLVVSIVFQKDENTTENFYITFTKGTKDENPPAGRIRRALATAKQIPFHRQRVSYQNTYSGEDYCEDEDTFMNHWNKDHQELHLSLVQDKEEVTLCIRTKNPTLNTQQPTVRFLENYGCQIHENNAENRTQDPHYLSNQLKSQEAAGTLIFYEKEDRLQFIKKMNQGENLPENAWRANFKWGIGSGLIWVPVTLLGVYFTGKPKEPKAHTPKGKKSKKPKNNKAKKPTGKGGKQ